MSDKEMEDPTKARYLRRRHNADGFDEEEEEQERNFKENPMDAINKASKYKTQKNLQKQVEYFGNAIEPFHMRQEQNIGDIDEDGFFVFKRKKGVRDAWLQSIDENEEAEAADKLVKKIKAETRFKSVYEAEDKINENDEESSEQQKEESDDVSEEKQEGLNMNEVIQLVISLIPAGSSANKEMKKLKGKKQMQQYNKLLFLCNQYIQKTGEHDILTKKKEELEEMLQTEKKEEEEVNWDEDSEEISGDKGKKGRQKEEDDDEDNIF